MTETDAEMSDRSIPASAQRASWILGQILRSRFSIRADRSLSVLRDNVRRPSIIAPNHQHLIDPWLIILTFRYEDFAAMTPIRVLATQSWSGPLRHFRRVIRRLYALYGVVVLPRRTGPPLSMEEKLAPMVERLHAGDVAAIFPEGHVQHPGTMPETFLPGVVHLHRASRAPILPLGVHLEHERKLRPHYVVGAGPYVEIPEELDLEDGAEWLRQRVVEVVERLR